MIGKNRIEKTSMIADKGNLYVCPTDKPAIENMHHVGTVHTDWQNLLSASPMMFGMLENVAKGMESILTIAESQGMDRVVNDLQEIIASVKIVQRVAIFGVNELTVQNQPTK